MWDPKITWVMWFSWSGNQAEGKRNNRSLISPFKSHGSIRKRLYYWCMALTWKSLKLLELIYSKRYCQFSGLPALNRCLAFVSFLYGLTSFCLNCLFWLICCSLKTFETLRDISLRHHPRFPVGNPLAPRNTTCFYSAQCNAVTLHEMPYEPIFTFVSHAELYALSILHVLMPKC